MSIISGKPVLKRQALGRYTVVRRVRRFFLAVVLDVYSRMPLAVATFTSQPDTRGLAALFEFAVQHFGPPRHLVTDQGKQFRAETFRELVDALGIQQRFGAVGQKGSVAIVERFWRTAKAAVGLRPMPPPTRGAFERRLELALAHYTHFRPHTGLDGATPATVFLRTHQPSHLLVQPPRGRVGEPAPPLGVEIASLDRRGRFPVLLRAAQPGPPSATGARRAGVLCVPRVISAPSRPRRPEFRQATRSSTGEARRTLSESPLHPYTTWRDNGQPCPPSD